MAHLKWYMNSLASPGTLLLLLGCTTQCEGLCLVLLYAMLGADPGRPALSEGKGGVDFGERRGGMREKGRSGGKTGQNRLKTKNKKI